MKESKETFITYYKSKYTSPDCPPLWAVTELMTLGELSKWFQLTKDNSVKSSVGHDLDLPTQSIIESILQVLSYVRNICAHHGRLWNRRLVKRVPYIRNFKEDLIIQLTHGKQSQLDNRIFNVMVVILKLLHHQVTDSMFPNRLKELVETVSDNDRETMGFPQNWRERPA